MSILYYSGDIFGTIFLVHDIFICFEFSEQLKYTSLKMVHIVCPDIDITTTDRNKKNIIFFVS